MQNSSTPTLLLAPFPSPVLSLRAVYRLSPSFIVTMKYGVVPSQPLVPPAAVYVIRGPLYVRTSRTTVLPGCSHKTHHNTRATECAPTLQPHFLLTEFRHVERDDIVFFAPVQRGGRRPPVSLPVCRGSHDGRGGGGCGC